MTVRIKIN